MSELATVGIDLAKSVFQINGVDENGRFFGAAGVSLFHFFYPLTLSIMLL
ncbi:hypothetical protein [Ensifer sp. LCM 4579]|nr:hypothetical protein [Ensifer sp. LCM 4579]